MEPWTRTWVTERERVIDPVNKRERGREVKGNGRERTDVSDVTMADWAEELDAVLEEVFFSHLEEVDEFGAVSA